MASAASLNSSLHPEVKACAEALQSAQKRMRLAFFLALAASSIVLLMVLNLWQSRLVLSELMEANADKSEYMKAYIKHVADNSFYQLPALGIQITCDDVGILGPLALLAFSFFSAIAFKALYCQVKSATKGPFEESPLIRALLEIEQPQNEQNEIEQSPKERLFLVLQICLFLPFVVCLVVIVYGIIGHFIHPPHIDSFPAISRNTTMARIMDVIGCGLALLVFLFNRQTFRLSKMTKSKAHECIKRHAGKART